MREKRFWAFLKLIRVEYSLFGASGVFLSGFLAGDLLGFQPEYLMAFFVVFFSAIGSFALNDYCDFEVDQRNRRYDRPLVSGSLSKEVAVTTAVASFSMVLLFSRFLNSPAMILVLVSLPFFIFYILGLKKIVLVKNVLIAYAYVATIFLGSLVSDSIVEPLIVYFAAMGFIVGLAFEIMLDIGDVEGDKDLGIETLSTRLGMKTAAQVSVFLYALIMILDPFPFIVMIDPRLHMDVVFVFLVLIPVVSYFFTSKSLMNDQSKSRIFQLKKRVFVTMQVGSIAYLIGVFL